MVAQPEKGRRVLSEHGAKTSETARLKREAAAAEVEAHKNRPLQWAANLDKTGETVVSVVRNHCSAEATKEICQALGLLSPGGDERMVVHSYVAMAG
jgi:hypothetical protein